MLAWAHDRATIVDVEIKNAPIYYAGIEEAVVAALHRSTMAEQVVVISFDHAAVQRVKALDARIVTGVLYAAGRSMRDSASHVKLAPTHSCPLGLCHPGDVQAAHAADLAVAPWATSDPKVLRGLVDAGVDAIGTITIQTCCATCSTRAPRRQNDRLARRLASPADLQLFLTSFLGLYAGAVVHPLDAGSRPLSVVFHQFHPAGVVPWPRRRHPVGPQPAHGCRSARARSRCCSCSRRS